MRKILLTLCFLSSVAFAKDTYVRGSFRKDGTYVEPHYRSAPNNSRSDNWGTQGNYNPYTGERGTKKNDDGYDRDRKESSREE